VRTSPGWGTTATPAATAIRFSDRLLDAGAVASIGTVGDSYDTQAESLIGLYKAECTKYEGPWRGVDDLELATLGWVHWFNKTRLHSSIGHVPLLEYEHYRHIAFLLLSDSSGDDERLVWRH
jgi:putative transposase